MKKLPRRCVSKRTSAPDKANKISKNMKIPAAKAKAPVESRRAALKMTKFLELEDENRESMDSGFGESESQVNHRYPTRARFAALATQSDDRKQNKSSSAKPAKTKRCKHPPDVDKENDGSAANGAQPRQGTSSNKRRSSGLPVSRPVSQNPATPEDLNSTKDRLSQCSSAKVGESQPQVNHRYPTRARFAARATQSYDRNQNKSSSAKPTKTKGYKHPPDVDKENDGSAANGAQPRQGTSSSKRRSSGLPVSRPVSQNPATPEDLNSTEEQLSVCSRAEWIDHIRWLQPRRDVGLWIECTRNGCGKWRYAENYHDPLDVPKIWFCDMNTDARFADCSIPQEETPEAEVQYYIENAYNAGSIVWARVNGFPPWPAMVDDCPDVLKYWDIRGSSIVPYKYHVKFFNEMKIAWIPVRNLKPYAENPRSTFLKKTVFRGKDYSKELDSACEVANQALPLKLLERLERFSWAAQISGGLCEEDEGLASDEGRAKKNKSANKSTIDPMILTGAADDAVPSPVSSSTRKRPVNKNVTKNVTRNTRTDVTENVTGKRTINVKSRIVNVETDSTINTRSLISAPTGVSIQITMDGRRSVSGSQLPCRDKVSFLEPNELFKGNSSDRSEVDNSNIDDAPVPSPASKSTQSTHEKKKCTEVSSNQWCPERVTRADIEVLAQEIRNTRPFYAMLARNSRAASQIVTTSNPFPALHPRELSPPVRSDEKFDRSSVNLRSSVDAPADIVPTISDRGDRERFSLIDICALIPSRTDAFVCAEEPTESPWGSIEIDLTGSSTDFEGDNDRRESPDYPSHAETRDNSPQPNSTLSSTSNGLGASFGSIESNRSFRSLALSSEPERDEMGDRCPSSCGLCTLSVDLEVSDSSVDAAASVQPDGPTREDREGFFANDIFVASSPRPEVCHSRSASRESGGASSFDWSSFGEGSGRSGRNSEKNFSASGSEGAFFRNNSASFHGGSGQSAGGSEINFSACGSGKNFPAGRSGKNFPAGRSGTNFRAGGSETNSCVGEDASTSSSREPILIDLTDSSTDFDGYCYRQEYPDFPSHAETRLDFPSFDPRFASTSNRFGPLNTAGQISSFESFKHFGSIAISSQPNEDEMSKRRTDNSAWRAPLADFQVSRPNVSVYALPEQDYSNRPNRAASLSSHEPASSEYVLNRNIFSPETLTRSRSSGSSRSSDTIVPSSQPEMDRAFEQSSRFPGLCNRLRDSSTSTYPSPKYVDFSTPGHFSLDCPFELITIDD